MNTYAYVYNGVVQEIIPPVEADDGTYIPLDQRFTPEFCAMCVDITDIEPQPVAGDVASKGDGGAWSFAPYVPPAPTQEQILSANTAMRNQLLAAAALAIAPLQDAVDLDEATAQETALLTQWKQFRVAVNRIDITKANPDWPAPPQTGYGAVVMDGTVV
ncbi:tail fiber assembly protein [Luteibacter aegosomaticola]|uniref:tail fiber assembly protein n=1 Tax=Luteibacter aegosomaticola TaxID=2911538 RepID=UPI001FFB437C|nr:tail fiber assembly protein [Luteibacter aegosomaticola]UPG89259.1 tail fiber assembly protein [Luteibacter aegosomaticola]